MEAVDQQNRELGESNREPKDKCTGNCANCIAKRQQRTSELEQLGKEQGSPEATSLS